MKLCAFPDLSENKAFSPPEASISFQNLNFVNFQRQTYAKSVSGGEHRVTITVIKLYI